MTLLQNTICAQLLEFASLPTVSSKYKLSNLSSSISIGSYHNQGLKVQSLRIANTFLNFAHLPLMQGSVAWTLKWRGFLETGRQVRPGKAGQHVLFTLEI